MKYLLDTATFVMLILDERHRLSGQALNILNDTENEYALSSVSTWEIAIKYSIGKLDLKDNPEHWLPDVILSMGLQQLPVHHHHTLEAMKLPWHHKDPFDRLLACQAHFENLPILTPDPIFKKYKVKTVW